MKVELFPFQKMALFQLRRKTAEALGSYQRTHTPQVLSFTAPTGAGKTIILASLIESIYFGDEEYPDQPDAIFVWLSDSPELNEQSRSKIDLKADKIRLNQCVTITDESFDQEMLDDGHIYFLNTQKLGKSSNLTKKGDGRTFTIWETLQNTMDEKYDRLYFIIDEAHRGMQGRAAAQATTIMQKFLKGSREGPSGSRSGRAWRDRYAGALQQSGVWDRIDHPEGHRVRRRCAGLRSAEGQNHHRLSGGCLWKQGYGRAAGCCR